LSGYLRNFRREGKPYSVAVIVRVYESRNCERETTHIYIERNIAKKRRQAPGRNRTSSLAITVDKFMYM
jgi:hypothetical protein